jgi:hypothetical protein
VTRRPLLTTALKAFEFWKYKVARNELGLEPSRQDLKSANSYFHLMDLKEVRMEATREADLFAQVAIEHAELGHVLNHAWEDSKVEVWRHNCRKVKST